jgi:hypothetical protein
VVVLILRFYQALFTCRSKSGKAQSEFASPKKASSLVILMQALFGFNISIQHHVNQSL